jgi:signal transduction histidine kinase/HPt (histidine-containing phosphotransfer) domain-containing protein
LNKFYLSSWLRSILQNLIKVSLQVKIGGLMFVAVVLIVSSGFLSYRSLSSIVKLIYTDSKPDLRLVTLKTISTDLEKAENSIRTYTLTMEEPSLAPYYNIIFSLDDKINQLRSESKNDRNLLSKIDTMSRLIENKFFVWSEMLDIYNNNNIENSLKKLSDEITVNTQEEKNILKKFFRRKQENDMNRQKIAEKILDIEMDNKLKGLQIKEKEAQLAKTNNKITNQFYSIIQQIEASEREKVKAKVEDAKYLANRTIVLLALFSVGSTALAILVLFIIVKYVRKTYAYQKALENSKTETENLVRTKELFMANVSHEIRTPLNAIAGFIEQILGEQLGDDVRDKLNIVKSSSDHLIRIISDILDFSRLQSGKMTLEKTHFRIENVLNEIFVLFENRAKDNHDKLVYKLPKAEIPVLHGDPFRLQQILYNLLSNAIKFTHNGSVIFSACAVDITPSVVRVAIKVEDTGIGISKEKLDKIFEDFTQAEPEIARKYGGTGLGLSIVKKLADLHHGSIDVKSEINKGSVFICYLDYEPGDMNQLKSSGIPSVLVPDEIQRIKVLVVDDEEYNRLLIKAIFKKWKIEFDEAVNGLDAIEMVKYKNYDLILMDSRMPVLNGVNATKFIRNVLDESKSKIPIIALTAAVSGTETEKYFISGINAVVQKPITEARLLEAILSTLGIGLNKPALISLASEVSPPGAINIAFGELYRLTGNDKTFVREMLVKFIETTSQGLYEMVEIGVDGDISKISELAHKLSSPCRHLGATVLLDYLKQIENGPVNESSPAKLKELITKACLEFEKLEQHITEHLNSMA